MSLSAFHSPTANGDYGVGPTKCEPGSYIDGVLAVGGVANPLDHTTHRPDQPASASVAVTVFSAPLRVKAMVTLSPTFADWMIPTRSSESFTGLPFTEVMTSPCCNPALAAALPAVTLLTRAPPPSASVTLTPSAGWLTFLPAIRSWATWMALLLGIAKPRPMLPELDPDVAIALLMPITWPLVLTSAPPELPGLIGASVCSRPEIVLLDCCCCCCWPNGLLPNGLCGVCSSLLDWMVRSLALMMPAVTDPSRPSGLPSART